MPHQRQPRTAALSSPNHPASSLPVSLTTQSSIIAIISKVIPNDALNLFSRS